MSQSPQRGRGAFQRFLAPGPDTSTPQLRAYLALWAALLALWVSAQFWMEPSTLNRWLYGVLALVAVTQMLGAIALLRKRR